LGTILYNMNKDHLRAFKVYVGQTYPELNFGRFNLDLALQAMFDYLKFAVFEPIKYLQESSQIWNDLFPDQQGTNIGFIEKPDKEKLSPSILNITNQLNIIEKYSEILFKYTDEKGKFSSNSIKENPGFVRLFLGFGWPITQSY